MNWYLQSGKDSDVLMNTIIRFSRNLKDFKFNHIVEVENGVMQQECEEILKNFFKELRKSKKKKIQ